MIQWLIGQQMIREFIEHLSFEFSKLRTIWCCVCLHNNQSLPNIFSAAPMEIFFPFEHVKHMANAYHYINWICSIFSTEINLRQLQKIIVLHWNALNVFLNHWCSEEKNIPTIRILCVLFFKLNFYNPYVDEKWTDCLYMNMDCKMLTLQRYFNWRTMTVKRLSRSSLSFGFAFIALHCIYSSISK